MAQSGNKRQNFNYESSTNLDVALHFRLCSVASKFPCLLIHIQAAQSTAPFYAIMHLIIWEDQLRSFYMLLDLLNSPRNKNPAASSPPWPLNVSPVIYNNQLLLETCHNLTYRFCIWTPNCYLSHSIRKWVTDIGIFSFRIRHVPLVQTFRKYFITVCITIACLC